MESGPEDIVYSNKVSGVHANFIGKTLPENRPEGAAGEEAKRWKDIWSAGQGVATISDVCSVSELVDRLRSEVRDAVDEQREILSRYV